MASLRRVPRSPNWIACFTGKDGKRHQRSTGVRVDGKVESRRRAQKIADEYEDIARGKRNARQVQSVFKDLYEDITGQNLPDATVADFGRRWVASKKAEVSKATHKFYETSFRTFLRGIGERADAPMIEINREDILSWRDREADRVSASTVNHNLKFVRMLFAGARREGLVAENPTEDVSVVKKTGKSTRRPFTLDELKAVLKIAGPEWRSMILFGLYTGQRLGDIAELTWGQVDLEANEIRIETNKTGRFQKIPIPSPLLKHLRSLPTPENDQVPLHPRAEDIVAVQGKTGSLSVQFQRIMAKAGIVEKKPHRKTERQPGRSGKRTESKVSFHSLRHTPRAC